MHAAPGAATAASQQPAKKPKLDVVVLQNHSEIRPQDDWYHSEGAEQIGTAGVTLLGDNGHVQKIFMASGKRIKVAPRHLEVTDRAFGDLPAWAGYNVG
eukprot:10541205-Karenia_brevis.AAC.1